MHLEKLRHEIFTPLDRTCDELREKRDEERVDAEVLLRRDLPAVYVDHVGEALEGVKRDADGQDDVQRGRAQGNRDEREQLRNRAGEEVEVLEEKQQQKWNRDGDGENPLARAPGPAGRGDQASGKIRLQRDARDEHHELGIPAHIKIIAGDQKKDPAEFMRQREIGKKDDDEEHGELPGVKEHRESFQKAV
jgi:hypothetical protein